MNFPGFGSVALTDWPVILTSFLLAWLEFLISIIARLLPQIVIDLCTAITTVLYNAVTTNPLLLIKSQKVGHYNTNGVLSEDAYYRMLDLLHATNVQEMCLVFGYTVENRIVRTKDGYLLTIHRISSTRHTARVPNGKVVYFHHGLLMNSEIWLTMLDKYSNLPYVLYDLGYDVWLGNNRGNKYSQKHLVHKLLSELFWDFSLDEFALFDIPSTIEFILNETSAKKLTYIGFSQGTAQSFASLSINPQLNHQIDRIIAISPATTPHGLYSKFLDILLKSSPNIMYLLFSRKTLMPSVVFWQHIMYPPLYNISIDIPNYILFNWKSTNITKYQKISSYAHLYSTTSVKSVVHWFQVMSSKNFQMYHDLGSNRFTGLNPMSYPLENIDIPINLIYGSIDSLVDIDVMKAQLPKEHTTAQAVESHEHLDNIWGEDVYDSVFSHVFRYLGEEDVTTRLLKDNHDSVKLIEDILPNDEDEETLNNLPLNYLKADAYHQPTDTAHVYSSGVKTKPHRSLSTGGSVFI
ncbi:triglyceride lipase-cholesterol esterase [Suhomyces tanzawaensis NRRL Y-17324]|uniref:Triglyceride lipase-cholesterol esterase n=1 Tax=Suhomyces tanzawaensis NRRL Y-17324 TaxID=984487 RepID=A0A1E4SLQ7_9ASCO|nr:triglyceride lipase-cholesterol esterase [Suhomyces tanzawaensis NRRL Y-17324]ODV80459.1 triglyceride lipase-cholesterol esterase [Suhomyces tanzawaensis NRRL Y-17324]